MVLYVTNILVTVTGGVTRDIPSATVAKDVVLDISDWVAISDVSDTV